MLLFWFSYIYHHRVVKHLIQYLIEFNTSILVQTALYFFNSFSSSIRKGIKLLFLYLSSSLILNVLTYPLILGNIKINGQLYLNI